MANQERVNIFLVEDQEMYAMMLDQKLKNNLVDHNLQIFESGEECLENIKDGRPDVVILDYLLPGMNGLETLKKIKEQDPDIPVIVISAQKEIQVTRDVLKAGAHDYIIKDKSAVDKLYNAINQIVERSDLENEVVTLQVKLNKNKMFMGVMGIVLIGMTILLIAMLVTS
jgi:DNA-binding NtrC family response regulator